MTRARIRTRRTSKDHGSNPSAHGPAPFDNRNGTGQFGHRDTTNTSADPSRRLNTLRAHCGTRARRLHDLSSRHKRASRRARHLHAHGTSALCLSAIGGEADIHRSQYTLGLYRSCSSNIHSEPCAQRRCNPRQHSQRGDVAPFNVRDAALLRARQCRHLDLTQPTSETERPNLLP